MSHECNKYIISSEEFVRDFEKMYQVIDDPWDQEKNHESDSSIELSLFLMQQYINVDDISSILDVGCATGYHSKKITDVFPAADYLGVDVSPTIVSKAKKYESSRIAFEENNIIEENKNYDNKFDLIFSSKTLYYVAPEIDVVIDNIKNYLKKSGYLFFVYNMTETAFTKKWLTYELLREKLLAKGFEEVAFFEVNRFSEQVFAYGLFQKK